MIENIDTTHGKRERWKKTSYKQQTKAERRVEGEARSNDDAL